MKQKVILSTGNPNKVRELGELLGTDRFEVVSKAELGFEDLEIPETGNTLQKNARQKVDGLCQVLCASGDHWENAWILADDTGLFVDALDGAPGIYAARYAGENVTEADNVNKLLAELQNVAWSNRTAHFETCIAVRMHGYVQMFIGRLDGRILEERRGTNGFGYDPVFYVPEEGKSLAEMSDEEKNAISHRGRAYQALLQAIERSEKADAQ